MRKLFVLGAIVLCAAVAQAGEKKAAPKAKAKAAAKQKVAKVKAPPPDQAALTETFDTFCGEWMGKLAVREHDNIAQIKWQIGPDGVLGEYVGYSVEHKCIVKELLSPDDTPIGKIIYRELVYRKKGASTSDAERAAPQAVDVTEVTEIFRFAQGKWVY